MEFFMLFPLVSDCKDKHISANKKAIIIFFMIAWKVMEISGY